ncbi:MAG: FG-GAP-like repeat-containing protein [bacterium]
MRISLICCLVLISTGLLYADMPYIKNPIWQSSESSVTSTGLVWQDADHDGDLDLFISNGNDITQSPDFIYYNNGSAIPTTHTWSTGSADYSGHCAVGDINGDGYPEFVVANYIAPGWGATNSQQYPNNGGVFSTTPAWTSPHQFHSFSSEFGDVDGDGDLDLAFACGEGYNQIKENLRVYYNVGGALSTDSFWLSGSTTYMLDLAWADYDRDGDLDLAFCGDEARVWLYLNNNGVLTALPVWMSGDPSHSNTLSWGDIDGDGYLELAVADNFQNGGEGNFKVYKNNAGSLSLTPFWESATGGYGSSVCWYDFDRDGDQDLATGRWWGEVTIYENTGTTLSASPVWLSNISFVVEEIRTCDIDGDGVEYYQTTRTDLLKVFYLDSYPAHAIDSVVVDGAKLTLSEYCYDLNSGWVSLATAPTTQVDCFYRYSDKQDIGASNWGGSNYIFADTLTHVPPEYAVGDCNGDQIINVADAVYILQYIFNNGAAPSPLYLGDVNCDGAVNITDPVYLIAYIFAGGPPPCEP